MAASSKEDLLEYARRAGLSARQSAADRNCWQIRDIATQSGVIFSGSIKECFSFVQQRL